MITYLRLLGLTVLLTLVSLQTATACAGPGTAPSATILQDIYTPVCVGQSITFWATNAGDCDTWEGSPVWDYPQQEFTFTWDFGDGTHESGNVPIAHSWSTPGVKIVTLGVHDPGNIWDDAVASVTASVTISAITSVTGPTHPLCPGEVAGFSAILNPPGADYNVNWTGGGVPPSVEHISGFSTVWLDTGVHTVTATCGCSSGSASVQVMEPLHEIIFLEQNGTGGLINVRMKVRTWCAWFYGFYMPFDFTIHEEGTPHPADWELLFPNLIQDSYDYDENTLIEEIVYIVEIDTLSFHNSTYTLRVDSDAYECPDYQTIVHHQVDKSLTICNLAIVSVNPENVLVWKDGLTSIPITVNLEDSDLNDPMNIELSIYDTSANNRESWPAIKSIPLNGVTGATHTFEWDGKDSQGYPVTFGAYTYEVTVTQPADEDSAKYRSTHLEIIRAIDEYGQPIYEAEFRGYDDNGTPDDEADDNYLYYVRYYALRDSIGIMAYEGELTMYDWQMTPLASWSVSSLNCEIHGANDGLVATTAGLQHGIIVPVPMWLLETTTEDDPEDVVFRFVLKVKDDHVGSYRNHNHRWARELNQATKPDERAWNFDCQMDDGDSLDEWGYNAQRHPVYGANPWWGCNDEEGYIAYKLGNKVSATVYDRLKRANIFNIHCHGLQGETRNGGGLRCADDGGRQTWLLDKKCGSSQCYCSNTWINVVENVNLSKCRLALLQGCYTTSTSTEHGNIGQRLIDRGARCVVGFHDEIGYWDASYTGPEVVFAGAFWKALCKPNDCVPKRPSDALDAGKQAVQQQYGNYHGYDTGDVLGNDLQIIPYK